MVRDGAEVLGLFMLVRHNAVTWEIHTCLLPSAWGRTIEAAREMAGWAFAHMPCFRIITNVPAYNRLALKFAQRAGMIEYGTNYRSYLKDGRLWDQICLGLSKET
jgi:RimJ/RimL family protein N-acetyltransferase